MKPNKSELEDEASVFVFMKTPPSKRISAGASSQAKRSAIENPNFLLTLMELVQSGYTAENRFYLNTETAKMAIPCPRHQATSLL